MRGSQCLKIDDLYLMSFQWMLELASHLEQQL